MSSLLLLLLIASVAADHYHPEPRASKVAPTAVRSALPASPVEVNPTYWYAESHEELQHRLRPPPVPAPAEQLIMFLGDGMSIPTLAAARALRGQRLNRTGEETKLTFETFPTVGLVKTYCVNRQVADSACSATAYLSGVKTNRGVIGFGASVRRRDCAASLASERLQSLAALALADGRDVGVVTTTRITHASPAGAYAHSANRNWENDNRVREDDVDPTACIDIAQQLVHSEPGRSIKVLLGGGRREFRPNTTRDEENTRGRRGDDRDLIEEWQQDKRNRNVTYRYVWNRADLLGLRHDPPEYLLGLFEGSHMEYHMEANPATEPTLSELTEIAIRSLRRNPRGFFLFVEGGRIDHAHHDNYVHLALDETLELDAAVETALPLLDPARSLVVVTSDHSHVMSFSGYPDRGADVLGVAGEADDGKPHVIISYANGPGARPRDDVTLESDYGSLHWRAPALVPLESETHGGDDVAVFATGVHHTLLSGMYEQSSLPAMMAWAACLPWPARALTPPDAPHCRSAAPRLRPVLLPFAVVSLWLVHQ